MAVSSKSSVEILVRIGILEKLVEALQNKIVSLEEKLMHTTIKLDKLLSGDLNPPAPMQVVDEDEWAIDNANGTVEKVSTPEEKKKAKLPRDDVSNILDS